MELLIRSSFFDRNRKLIINQDYIEFEDKDLNTASQTKFLKEEIESFRYGIKWIRGYQFVIGRIYCIDVKSKSGVIIKLRLKSLYKINLKHIAPKFSQVISALYHNFFDSIVKEYLSDFTNGKEFQILGVTFCEDGLYLQNQKALINWLDVGTKSYSTYYAIFSQSDASCYKAFEYINDWNTGVLYKVSRTILREKGLYTE